MTSEERRNEGARAPKSSITIDVRHLVRQAQIMAYSPLAWSPHEASLASRNREPKMDWRGDGYGYANHTAWRAGGYGPFCVLRLVRGEIARHDTHCGTCSSALGYG